MTLPVISATARALMRARFAADMIDTVLIQRGLPGTFDPTTGVTSGMSGVSAVYSGAARLTPASPSGDITLGDGEIYQRQMTCQIPWDSSQVFVNDLLSVDASQDPNLVGSSWRVIGSSGSGSWGVLTTLTLTGWYPSSTWSA